MPGARFGYYFVESVVLGEDGDAGIVDSEGLRFYLHYYTAGTAGIANLINFGEQQLLLYPACFISLSLHAASWTWSDLMHRHNHTANLLGSDK